MLNAEHRKLAPIKSIFYKVKTQAREASSYRKYCPSSDTMVSIMVFLICSLSKLVVGRKKFFTDSHNIDLISECICLFKLAFPDYEIIWPLY